MEEGPIYGNIFVQLIFCAYISWKTLLKFRLDSTTQEKHQRTPIEQAFWIMMGMAFV